MVAVEYLLPFDTSEGICGTKKSFNSLLCSNAHFTVSKKQVTYKDSQYNYTVEHTEVEDVDCSVFHVRFEAKRVTKKFLAMLRAFRSTFGPHLRENILVVWDGVTHEWATELYPQIFEVENLLRKLISKFMLTKLGIGWHRKAVPPEVNESVRSKDYRPTHGILYQVDFIQLSHFLFKQYALKDSSKLQSFIAEVAEKGFNEDQQNELHDYVPLSNWDRYFSSLVECSSDELAKDWAELYELRCKVAHNRSMSHEEYERTVALCDSLETTLSKALREMNRVEIPEEKKEEVSMHTVANASDIARYYVDEYTKLNENIATIQAEAPFVWDQTSYASPATAFMAFADDGKIEMTDTFRTNLFTIEDSKNLLLAGDSATLTDRIWQDNQSVFRITDDQLNSDSTSAWRFAVGGQGLTEEAE